MNEFTSLLFSVLNVRVLLLALALVVLVLLVGYTSAKSKKARKKGPGQFLRYETPGQTAAECLAKLRQPMESDVFAYTLENAKSGGFYINFKLHNETRQMVDTLFLLAFETEIPAMFTLTFIREAFGAREPVMPEAMVDEFFEKKLGARRCVEEEKGESATESDKE